MRLHFAGVNRVGLAEATKGQDVLVSYHELRVPSVWAWLEPMLVNGFWNSCILDSGAFTIYIAQLKWDAKTAAGETGLGARPELIDVEEYAAFVEESGDLFDWIANMDDIAGDTATSNANFERLSLASDRVVPVWHEGETRAQLDVVIEQARSTKEKRVAIGMQRPNGQLVPTNVVACLTDFMPLFRELAPDLALHGFGLTRYASADTCPCDGPGWAFESVDSTTWNNESCKLEKSGAANGATRSTQRRMAFQVTIWSYRGVSYRNELEAGTRPLFWDAFNPYTAAAAGGQARTVAVRWLRAEAALAPIAQEHGGQLAAA